MNLYKIWRGETRCEKNEREEISEELEMESAWEELSEFEANVVWAGANVELTLAEEVLLYVAGYGRRSGPEMVATSYEDAKIYAKEIS